MKSGTIRTIGAAVVVLLCVAAVVLGAPLLRRGSLVDALSTAGTPRVLAARVSVTEAYSACEEERSQGSRVPRTTCGDTPAPSRSLLRLSARASAALQAELSAEALHAVALLDLLWSGSHGPALDRAIYQLGAAARASARPAAPLADLAAAHLARAERDDTLHDLLEAADAAERALAAEPYNRAAAFNHALALDRLGLREAALAGWERYQTIDASSGWAREARTRAAAVSRAEPHPTAPPTTAAAAPAATPTAAATPGASIDDYVRNDPQGATLLGWDRLLPEWAEALAAGDRTRADAVLEHAYALGSALARAGLDASLRDGAAAVRASAAEPALRQQFVTAHRAYGEARGHYNAAVYGAAGPLLAEAMAAAPRGSPLWQWAAVFHAATLAYEGRPPEAIRQAGAIAQAAHAHHPALAGRARWVLGTSLLRRGDIAGALDAYTTAGGDFERADEMEHRGAVQFLAAECELMLGNAARAHASVHQAALELRRFERSVWRYSVLTLVAQIAEGEGLLLTALRVQDEAISAAEANGGAVYVVEARLARARLLATAGRPIAGELAAVEPHMERLNSDAARDWMAADLRLAQAIAARPHDPAGSAATLDEVVAFFEAARVSTRLVSALTARADARLAAGDHAGGEADLTTLASLLEEQRAAVTRVPLRASLLQDAQGVFERMALMHAAAGRPADALAELQRGRSTTHGVVAPGNASAPLRLAAATDPANPTYSTHPPPAAGRETVLQLALVGDSLLAWTVIGGDVQLTVTAVNSAELRATVHRARWALELRADSAVVHPPLAALHALLVAPVAGRLRGDALVIIPYGELADVPYAALWDEAAGRYLVERWRLRFASTLAAAARPARRRAASPLVTVVADPAFDAAHHRGLRRLPGAAAEADAIRSVYPAAHILAGRQADGAAVAAALTRATVAHYAGHAVLDDVRPERSYLVLAAPVGGGAGAPGGVEGRLTAEDIQRLDLRALDLVVLSACRTLESRSTRSSGFAGVADAFLAGGAGGVIGATWRVDDALTAPLMAEFHGAYAAGRTAADALRDAQLRMIRASDSSLRSPSAWGGFRYAGH